MNVLETHKQLGGSWRFSRADINSWIKQQSMAGLETSREQDGDATGQPNNGERQQCLD